MRVNTGHSQNEGSKLIRLLLGCFMVTEKTRDQLSTLLLPHVSRGQTPLGNTSMQKERVPGAALPHPHHAQTLFPE